MESFLARNCSPYLYDQRWTICLWTIIPRIQVWHVQFVMKPSSLAYHTSDTTPEELYSKNASEVFATSFPGLFPNEVDVNFRCTLPRIGNLKNSRITGYMFGFVFRINSGTEVTWLMWRHRFQNGFRPENEKPASSRTFSKSSIFVTDCGWWA